MEERWLMQNLFQTLITEIVQRKRSQILHDAHTHKKKATMSSCKTRNFKCIIMGKKTPEKVSAATGCKETH